MNTSSRPEFTATLESLPLAGKVRAKIRETVLSGEVSTLEPLEVAQQNGQHSIQCELLMLT